MSNRSQSSGVRASQRRRSKKTIWSTFGQNMPAIVTAVVAIAGLSLSIINASRTSDLESKRFDLSLFELSLPYFDNYVSSVETAFSSCQIIAQLGLGLDGNKKPKEDSPILSMLRNTVNSDTRIPELGPRPSDQCIVYLAEALQTDQRHEPPVLQERLVLAINSNFTIQCDEKIASESQLCVMNYIAKNFIKISKWFFDYLKVNKPKVQRYGELRLYFTGKRFRIVLVANSPYSEESLSILASRLRLIQDIYLNPQTENRSHQIVDPSAFNYCQIDTSKTYTADADISSVYVNGDHCNTFPNAPPQNSTPP